MNSSIIRAFVAMRQMVLDPTISKIGRIENEINKLKEYIEEAFPDYNDINDDTGVQPDMINGTLAELQTQKKLEDRPLKSNRGFEK